jgi:hypothetical protein
MVDDRQSAPMCLDGASQPEEFVAAQGGEIESGERIDGCREQADRLRRSRIRLGLSLEHVSCISA